MKPEQIQEYIRQRQQSDQACVPDIWPEHWDVLRLFVAMETQWRTGPKGPVGLDYNVLPQMWKYLKIKKPRRGVVFDDLKVMESEALLILHKPIA